MDFENQPTETRRGKLNYVSILEKTKEYLFSNRKIALVLLIGASLFYWYEIRPINISQACTYQASSNAKTLIQNKARVATDPERKASYAELVSKNMYLRSDYESFYKKCLRSYGVYI